MPEATLLRCTEATGVCAGFSVRADRGEVQIGNGRGYVGGLPVAGAWTIDLKGERGWRFVQVAPDAGGFAHAQAQEDALPLAVVRVEHGAVTAIRDVRPRLYAWTWLAPPGALLFAAQDREVVTRVQGAVQTGGLWETARAFVPWSVGSMLEQGAVTQGRVTFDKPAQGAAGIVLETVGLVR